jgi:hypothetical protein
LEACGRYPDNELDILKRYLAGQMERLFGHTEIKMGEPSISFLITYLTNMHGGGRRAPQQREAAGQHTFGGDRGDHDIDFGTQW